MADNEMWWAGLTDADRDMFLEYRDSDQLPANVVTRLAQTGQIVVGIRWVDSESDYTFTMPGDLADFLDTKVTERV